MTQPWHGSLRGMLSTLALLLAAMLLPPPAHASTGSLTDTSVADFNAGGPLTDTYIAETDDGEVILTPTAGVEFYGSAMPAGWSSTPLESEGTAIVQDGALQADGARVSADLAHAPGRSLEFVATFGADRLRAPASATSLPGRCSAPLETSTDLHARTNVGIGSLDTLIPGSFLGAPHRYRIDWNLASVDFFIDGAWSPHIRSPQRRACHPLRPTSSSAGRASLWTGCGSARTPPPAASCRGCWTRGGGSTGKRCHGRTRTPPARPFSSALARRHADTRTGPGPRLPRSLSRATRSVATPATSSIAPTSCRRSRANPGPRHGEHRLYGRDRARPDDRPVSDTLIGPSDTGTDVTWHADENGTYSVRVGGADCATGTEVESGCYRARPPSDTATVSAASWPKAPNTIRVCVADAAGNEVRRRPVSEGHDRAHRRRSTRSPTPSSAPPTRVPTSPGMRTRTAPTACGSAPRDCRFWKELPARPERWSQAGAIPVRPRRARPR